MTEEEKQIEKEKDEARQRWLSMPIASPWEQRASIQEVVNTVKTIMANLVTPRVCYEVEAMRPEYVTVHIDTDIGRGGFEIDTFFLMTGTSEQRRNLIAHHLLVTIRNIMAAAYLK